MHDIRIHRWAKTLVTYSLQAKPGEVIVIDASPLAQPLVEAVYEQLLRAKAWPVLRATSAELQEIFFKRGDARHFDSINPYVKSTLNAIDGTLTILSSSNTRALSSVDSRRQARFAATMAPAREILSKRKWTLTLYPTAAYAQDAEMSLKDFENYVFAALFADEDDPVARWRELERRQAGMIRGLRGARTVRIVGPDTDLSLSVAGRTFINSSGRRNMPSGEIFTGPVENSAEGHIRFDYPVCEGGREIAGIRLVFRRGRVVEASAEKNEDYLLRMLDIDPGARRLGELGIGTNTRIDRFTKNILFDEKIGGTIHLALGRSYPETGGRNRSALHWDMIKDMRRGGALYVDGCKAQNHGTWLK